MNHPGFYSVVRFCLDIERGEAVDVGVVVGSPGLGMRVRMAERNEHVKRRLGTEAFDNTRLTLIKEGFVERLKDVEPRVEALAAFGAAEAGKLRHRRPPGLRGLDDEWTSSDLQDADDTGVPSASVMDLLETALAAEAPDGERIVVECRHHDWHPGFGLDLLDVQDLAAQREDRLEERLTSNADTIVEHLANELGAVNQLNANRPSLIGGLFGSRCELRRRHKDPLLELALNGTAKLVDLRPVDSIRVQLALERHAEPDNAGQYRPVAVNTAVSTALFARKRGGTGFVVIAIAGDQPGLFELPPPSMSRGYLITELRFHGAPSIAADGDGYTITTELADQFGPGCWVSRLSDTFGLVAGPGSLESTQQADCDSSTVAASTGAIGAAMAWMDRDPANSYAAFRAGAGGSGTASMAGEIGVGLPIVTATSTGVAVLYRSTAGVRVFDAAGARTLAPPGALADLVTWGDHAIAVWTAAAGEVQLTRLCPAASP